MAPAIMSACAIRASLCYFAMLYSALTNIVVPLSEKQMIIGSADNSFASAFAFANTSGLASEYHYNKGLTFALVGVRNVTTHPFGLDNLTAMLADGPVVATDICGVITGLRENNTLLVVRDLDGAEQLINITQMYESLLKMDMWGARVYDLVAGASPADNSDGMTTTMKLVIATLSLLGTASGALLTKWGVKHIKFSNENGPKLYLA